MLRQALSDARTSAEPWLVVRMVRMLIPTYLAGKEHSLALHASWAPDDLIDPMRVSPAAVIEFAASTLPGR